MPIQTDDDALNAMREISRKLNSCTLQQLQINPLFWETWKKNWCRGSWTKKRIRWCHCSSPDAINDPSRWRWIRRLLRNSWRLMTTATRSSWRYYWRYQRITPHPLKLLHLLLRIRCQSNWWCQLRFKFFAPWKLQDIFVPSWEPALANLVQPLDGLTLTAAIKLRTCSQLKIPEAPSRSAGWDALGDGHRYFSNVVCELCRLSSLPWSSCKPHATLQSLQR